MWFHQVSFAFAEMKLITMMLMMQTHLKVLIEIVSAADQPSMRSMGGDKRGHGCSLAIKDTPRSLALYD